MARTLKIHLTALSPVVVHEWRNFGEDVYRALREECEVSTEEIDASTCEFFVRGIRSREVRRTVAIVRKIAERHLMLEVVSVVEIACGKEP